MVDEITTGDARELAKRIPDASVDLVFTDPVYERIEDYAWLATEAARVLKPGGALLAFCAKTRAAACHFAIVAALDHAYTLDYIVQGKSHMLNSRKVFCWSTPCLWFYKAPLTPPRSWLPDAEIIHFGQIAKNGTAHKWSKDPGVVSKWLEAFCAPGAVVWEPFCGGGTIPAVCKMLGRHYIASEIDPATAERARERVLNTQPPLPGLVVEQEPLMELV